MAQRIKCLPAMQETRVQSLGREDPLEKEMATHSSILAWRIPWSLAGYSPRGCKELDTTSLSFSLSNSDTIQQIIFKAITIVNVIINVIRKIFRS